MEGRGLCPTNFLVAGKRGVHPRLHDILWYFGPWFGWCDRSLELPGHLVVFGVLCSFIQFGDPPGGEVQRASGGGQFSVGARLWWGPGHGEGQSLVGQLRWGRSCLALKRAQIYFLSFSFLLGLLILISTKVYAFPRRSSYKQRCLLAELRRANEK